MNNLTSDGIETLKGCKLPLASFSFTGFFGAPGCGKTTQLQNAAEAVVKWSKTTSYDLDNPTLCNGSVTHNIFMSPSTHSDNTLKNKNNQILIEANDQNILDIIDSIRVMSDKFYKILNVQKFLRSVSKDIYQEKYSNKHLLNIKQILQQHPSYKIILQALIELEQFKKEYPELVFKETDQQIVQVLSDITSNKISNYSSRFTIGIAQSNSPSVITEFDGFMVRRPKVILIVDDQTGSKLFRDVGNEFYRALSQRRHLSLFFTGVSIHSPGALQIGFKAIMNSCLLFRGIPIEKLKDIYGTIQALDSIDFNVNNFIDIYQDITGFNETDMSKKESFRFNFLYVQSQPITSIWFKFDKRLK
ncbi:Conserved_hypothetical protein [Hexamita inflata]|uniref:Uncharacterized protein n=1 Tax=Hexamita inflata TaxID=28002 RepID=A0AA86UIS3_9EUKA|nr:Conserved hypothetical protein [Hexamita inflata]